jgi:uncharacterized protein YjbI with pentapeptide repeats
MKVIKPQRLGLLSRVFEYQGNFYFTVSVLVFFPFESPSFLLPEVKLWQLLPKELGKDAVFDAAMPKPNPEVLVTGHAYPPGGEPKPACAVRVKLGSMDKTLYVMGDRFWQFGGPTAPIPFTQMPITFERAFGGPGYAFNPIGRGHTKLKDEFGREYHPLPNVENPANMIKSPGDKPKPAGFGAFDIMWPQRFSKFGTYDQKWLKEGFPGFAEDTDLSLFNTTAEDQWIKGELAGDEAFQIENMHPERPMLVSRLPGVRGVCFIRQKTRDGEVFREVGTRIDTIHFLPHLQRGVVIFRGTTTVREDDAADILTLLIAAEDMAAAPKSADHYRSVMEARLDKEKGALLSLKDSDLMPPLKPPEVPLADEVGSDMDELVATERLLEKNLRNKVDKEVAKVRADLEAMGLNADDHVPKTPAPEQPPSLDNLTEYVESLNPIIEQAKKISADTVADAKASLKATCEQAGLDYEKTLKKAERSGGGPPKFSAKKEMEELRMAREHMKASGIEIPEDKSVPPDEEIERRLIAAEQQLMDAYRRFAHFYPETEVPEGGAAVILREQVILAHRNGESLAGRDLTGVDLSNLDLSGINLQGALLESANFEGTNLSGAVLAGAVLARANFTRAHLEGAVLLGANLGRAILREAQLIGGIDMTGATLMYADMSGASFQGAKLDRVDMFEAIFRGVSFREIQGTMLNFIQSDLSDVSFARAQVLKCNFVETTLNNVDFTGATLTQSVFVSSRGTGVKFRGASAGNLRAVKESAFPGADFLGAFLDGSNLRGTNLEGADLSGASLSNADFSECNLRGAKLYRAKAISSLFIRTDFSGAYAVSVNMMQAILQKAKLFGANFQGANLFRADLARSEGDKSTSFEDAVVRQVRFVNARKGGEA